MFRKMYGTHFIVGMKSECSMNIFFKRKSDGTSSKSNIALEMEMDAGMFEASAKMKAGIEAKRSMSTTEVKIHYKGANDKNWITSLSLKDLRQALVDFPENCVGGAAWYILWPY